MNDFCQSLLRPDHVDQNGAYTYISSSDLNESLDLEKKDAALKSEIGR